MTEAKVLICWAKCASNGWYRLLSLDAFYPGRMTLTSTGQQRKRYVAYVTVYPEAFVICVFRAIFLLLLKIDSPHVRPYIRRYRYERGAIHMQMCPFTCVVKDHTHSRMWTWERNRSISFPRTSVPFRNLTSSMDGCFSLCAVVSSLSKPVDEPPTVIDD